MTTSPNLNLKLYDATDTSAIYLTWCTDLAGSQSGSNFMLLDTSIGNINSAIEVLQSAKNFHIISFTDAGSSVYIGTSDSVEAYTTGMLLVASLGSANTGITTLNINALGAKYVKRVNRSGGLVDVSSGELTSAKDYLLKYNGTHFVVISAIVGADILVSGTSGNFLKVNTDNSIADSGLNSDDFSPMSHAEDTDIHLTSTEKGDLHTHTNKSTIDGIDGTAITLWNTVSSKVPSTRTINGYDLSANRSLTASDVGAVATSGSSTSTTVTFTEAASRAAIATGETLATMFGKIKKWYTDLGNAAWLNTGTSAGTVATGNHAHGNITTAGAIGSTADLPAFTGTSGVLTTKTVADARAALGVSAVVPSTINTASTTATLSLTASAAYEYDTALTALTLTATKPSDGNYHSYSFMFSSGSTATTLSVPAGWVFSGDSCDEGVFTPEASTAYEMIGSWYNSASPILRWAVRAW